MEIAANVIITAVTADAAAVLAVFYPCYSYAAALAAATAHAAISAKTYRTKMITIYVFQIFRMSFHGILFFCVQRYGVFLKDFSSDPLCPWKFA